MSHLTILKSLNYFFNPRSVAVIGASGTPGKIGYTIFNNLIKGYFRGRVYPVNPSRATILGKTCYKSISEVPEQVDLAIIAVKADIVPEVLLECEREGVKAAIIISAGFKEIGEEGRKREEKISEIVKRGKIRVLGPNCIGVFDNSSGLSTLFFPDTRMEKPKPGHISFVSQSGVMLAMFLDWAAKENIGIAKAVNLGNRVDVDESDFILYLTFDEETKVILLYLEGLEEGKGRKFIEACKFAAFHKPIIAVKGGKTESGSKAVLSHTGSLAGNYNIYKAAFKQANVIEAKDFQEMIDMAKALVMLPLMTGNRVAVITNAGGAGVMATDALESKGFKIIEIDEKTQSKLKESLPAAASTKNPIDMTGDATAEHYRIVMNTVANLDYIDALLVCIGFHPPTIGFEVLDYVYYTKEFGKPIVSVVMGGALAERLSRIMENNQIPAYPTPERAATALYALYEYSKIKQSYLKI
jgi:acetyl coenzyme A synthetase (ADP forming)-like protein